MDMIFVKRLALGGAGPTVAIKDSINIAGLPTRCGSAVLEGALPATAHAEVVEQLIRHGARIIGKANMHEFAYGVTGINQWTGTPPNSRYPSLVPGGSSSGCAAAVAAGLADIAIGTDTGGSIRVPAACCGVFGFKPSFGRVSRKGVAPTETSLDCVGPFAGTMAMIERAMALIDPTFLPVRPPTQGVLGIVAVQADAEVLAAFTRALTNSGLEVRPVMLGSLSAAFDAGMAIIAAETFVAIGCHVDHIALGEDVRARLLAAGTITPQQVAEAEDVRKRFRAEVDDALQHVDALALPTLPHVPPTIVEAADATASLRLTALVRPFNLSGHPALTIPIETVRGLPAGLQLVGRLNGDAQLCALGSAIAETLNANEKGKAAWN